ncbi:MAG: hypothetical protein QXH80_00745, partial [Candidatus Nanoarchaeia archaeon]
YMATFFRGKKGVSNIVLMLGIVLTIAILLIGGAGVVIKLIDAQARASPEFIATTLVSTINTVEAAPETATFNYYTETDADGYPNIGSLEINDDTNQLCIHSKTEDEIFASIATKTAVAAGFGGIEYAFGKQRSAVAKKATQKALTQQEVERVYPYLSKNPGVLARATEPGEVGELTRKYLSGKASVTEVQLLKKKVGNEEFSKLRLASKKMNLAEKQAIGNAKPSRMAFITKYTRRVSAWVESKVSVVTSKITVWAEKNFSRKAIKYAKGAYSKLTYVKGGVKTAAFIGGIAALQTVLTGGDWEDFTASLVQMSIYAIVPQVTKYVIVKAGAKQVKSLGLKIATNLGSQRIKGGLAKLAPPAGTAACFSVHAVQVVINTVWSIYDTILFDAWLFRIYDGAGKAVKAEKDAVHCETFRAPKQVLLTPPNCVPKATFKTTSTPYAAGYTASGILFSSAAYSAATSAVFTCQPGGVKEEFDSAVTLPALAVSAVAMGTTTGTLIYELQKNPDLLIPETSCDPAPGTDTCDATYLGQDCPNWFISTSPDVVGGTQTGVVLALMQGGPVCTALSISSGWGGMACNAARVSFAIAAFLAAPQNVYQVMLQADKVGFTKTVQTPKSGLRLDKEFANNVGFWYAEFPYVIEMTKIYTDDANSDDRHSNLVIRKA